MKRILATMLCLTISAGLSAEDWKQFRGPTADGASPATELPISWGGEENLVWRTELPGLGTSSPITLGDKIYLTCYSGYGIEPSQGDPENLVRHVVCLDRASGKIRWSKDFSPALPESTYSGGTNAKHGYGSSTPTTDGERLYIQFGKSGVYCFNLDGEQIWQAEVGEGTHRWGSSNSPLLYKNLVIVNASVECGDLIAFNRLTGQEVWRASGMIRSWSSPHLVQLENGASELVVCVRDEILGFNPNTGRQIWHCAGIPSYVCPSVISSKGIVYATGGVRKQFVIAVRAGGSGDVTESHVLWRVEKGSNVSSLVFHDGYVYCANDSKGIVFCFDARTGDVKYETRLRPRPGLIYSSPIISGGNIYYASQHNGTFVVRAAPEFELLAHNTFDDDDSRLNACPVVDGQRILLRNDKYLYCLGAN